MAKTILCKAGNLVIRYFSYAVVLLCMLIPLKAESFMKEKTKYLIAYYIPPEIETYVPVTKDDIEERSLSKIFIGNTERLRQIKEIVDNIINKNEISHGIDHGISFKVIFFNVYGEKEVLFADKNRNFEFKKIKGKISKEYFDKLINIFDLCKEIVDIKYFSKIEKEKLITEDNPQSQEIGKYKTK